MTQNTRKYLTLLFTFIVLHIAILIISNITIPIDDLFEKSLSQQMSSERISHLIKFQSKWNWLSYIIITIIVPLRIGLTVLCLKIGELFFNFQIKNYRPIIIACEGSIICLNVFTLTWFLINLETISLDTIRNFAPLSIISLFNLSDVDQLFRYPLRIINAFEISLWFILAYLISKDLKLKFWKAFEFVMSTYGVGLLIWVTFIMFLTVNNS